MYTKGSPNLYYKLTQCILTRLTQSMAILEFINELKPEANLLPKDILQKAKVHNSYHKMIKYNIIYKSSNFGVLVKNFAYWILDHSIVSLSLLSLTLFTNQREGVKKSFLGTCPISVGGGPGSTPLPIQKLTVFRHNVKNTKHALKNLFIK